MRIPASCLLILLLPGCAAAEPPTLQLEEPWVRAAPPGAAALAAYATLRNVGAGPLVVRPCPSAGFAAVSLHQTTHDDGVARMRPLQQIEIQPREAVTLAPGGMHLMLEAPQAQAQVGQQLGVCLAVDGIETIFEFQVRRATAAADRHGHH